MFRKYWERNLSVIPVKGKRPVIAEWQAYCHEQATEEEIELWEHQYKYHGVGLACGPASNLIALDIDRNDAEFLAVCPLSPVIKVGSPGKETRFFRYSEDIVTEHLTGWDILSVGSQTVLPPSIHPVTGQPYYYSTPDTLDNFSALDLPELKQEDIRNMKRVSEGESGSTVAGVFSHSDNTRCPHGSHNRVKTMAAGFIAGRLSFDDAVRRLLDYDNEHHKPIGYFSDKTRPECKGDPYSNAAKFYANILATTNRTRLRNGQEPEIPNAPITIKVSDLVKSPSVKIEFPKMTGTIQLFMDAILSISRSDQRQMALGASLAVAGILSANRFSCAGRPVYTNLFVLLSARSSMGKNAPFKFIQTFLGRSGIGHNKGYNLLGMANYSSDATLAKRLGEQRTRLDFIDEFGKVFKGLSNSGDHKATIGEALKMLFNSTDEFAGHEIKDGITGQCKFPAVGLFGAIQHSTFSKHATAEILFDGLLSRFLYFFDDLDAPWLGRQENTLSAEIIKHIADICLKVYPPAPPQERDIAGNLISDPNMSDFTRTELYLEPGLEAYIDALDEADYQLLTSNYRAGKDIEATVQGRRMEIARRIMFIIGISDGERTITRDHFDRAYALTLACEKQAMAIISPIVSGVAQEKSDLQAAKILELLKSGPKTYRDISRHKGMSRKYVSDALRLMLQSGEIVERKIARDNGHTYTGYELIE